MQQSRHRFLGEIQVLHCKEFEILSSLACVYGFACLLSASLPGPGVSPIILGVISLRETLMPPYWAVGNDYRIIGGRDSKYCMDSGSLQCISDDGEGPHAQAAGPYTFFLYCFSLTLRCLSQNPLNVFDF